MYLWSVTLHRAPAPGVLLPGRNFIGRDLIRVYLVNRGDAQIIEPTAGVLGEFRHGDVPVVAAVLGRLGIVFMRCAVYHVSILDEAPRGIRAALNRHPSALCGGCFFHARGPRVLGAAGTTSPAWETRRMRERAAGHIQ